MKRFCLVTAALDEYSDILPLGGTATVLRSGHLRRSTCVNGDCALVAQSPFDDKFWWKEQRKMADAEEGIVKEVSPNVDNEEIARLKKREPELDKELGRTDHGVSSKSYGRSRLDGNRQEHFDPGIDITAKEEEEKRESRAARFGVQSHTFDYKALPEANADDEAKKKERAARFGVQYQATDQSGQQNQDLWESRREQSAEVPRRAEVIHLYGVDVMSTEEVLVYFRDYSPLRIEWIDDSSCNVIFSSEAAAKRAIVSHGQPFKAGEAPELQGKDFLKNDEQPVPLIYRMATVEDRKGRAHAKSSRYLWLEGASQPKARARHVKRKAVTIDKEGDVIMMGGDRILLPNVRKQKKRRQRAPNGKEIEMKDAEEPLGGSVGDIQPREADVDANGDSIEAETNQDKDLREILKEKRGAKPASGAKRLFSSAAAGILPNFLKAQVGVDAQPKPETIQTLAAPQDVSTQDGDVEMA